MGTMRVNTESVCSLAYNGREALNKVIKSVNEFRNIGERKCGFELILMDCNMPFMDGYDATTEIREFLYSKSIRQPLIIAVTGHTEPNYVKRARVSGMNQVLSKPVNPDLLRKLLRKMRLVA
jgi:CheY-like chemotaxis protein